MNIVTFKHKATPMTAENEAVYADLRAENERLGAELSAALAMLKRLCEWKFAYDYIDGERHCLCCDNTQAEGHVSGCELAAALRPQKEPA